MPIPPPPPHSPTRSVAVRNELLRSLLNADLLGFLMFEYTRNFLSCCKRMLGLEYEFHKGGYLGVEYEGRHVMLQVRHRGRRCQGGCGRTMARLRVPQGGRYSFRPRPPHCFHILTHTAAFSLPSFSPPWAQVSTFGISPPMLAKRIRAMDSGSPLARSDSTLELGDRITKVGAGMVG